MPLGPKSQIGAYKIVGLIGAGGMGEVYRASDPRLKRNVAIKVLPEAFAQDRELVHRFNLEAQAVGRLNHPNVLAVYDTGVHEGSPYLVSELLEGESLRGRLRTDKLSPQRALDYARQIARGLAAAHAAGIVHRDLKPENLFITRDGLVKILDFGLAKLRRAPAGAVQETLWMGAVPGTEPSQPSTRETQGTRTFETTPGTILGTVAYMSPEQIRGQQVDHRSDIFSFGCVLHEMLTGEQPFKGASPIDMMSATLSQERPELTVTGGLAPALDRIVGHCLEKEPGDRFQSAQDLAFDLAAISEVSPVGRLPVVPRRQQKWLALAAFLLAVVALLGMFLLGRRSTSQPETEFRRLTYRRGTIGAARFASDSQTIVYSAMWEDEPEEVFSVRLDSPESHPRGLSGTGLLGISRSGELALLQKPGLSHSPWAQQGLLARVPFSGGSPRAIEEKVVFADWSPEGEHLCLARETETGYQIEYPPGTVLHRGTGFSSGVRVSPSGEHVAFVEHPNVIDSGGILTTVDKSGRVKALENFAAAFNLAWSPNGKEIWVSGAIAGMREDLWAVTLHGSRRLLLRQSASTKIQDVTRDGRALITNVEMRQRMFYRGPSDNGDRELTWLDWSMPTDLSPDGKYVLFSETGQGAGALPAIYLRETNGTPAVKLGAGTIATFSPDGKFVLTPRLDDSGIAIYPVGAGPTRQVALKGFVIVIAGMLQDGQRVWFEGSESSHGRRIYLTSVDGEKPRPITPEGSRIMNPFTTPDGKFLLAGWANRISLVPIEGGEPKLLPGVQPGEVTVAWGADEGSFFVYALDSCPAKVFRVDRKSGRRQFVREIVPSERAGMGRTGVSLFMTPNGRSYVYSTLHIMSELYLVTGLK
ncbi:MAG: protein kinase [Terriglobia bacterium]